MPIYAYKCESCGHAKDVLQKMSDPLLSDCPQCGASTFKKQVTAAGFQLKGSGWYVTDFRGGNTAAVPPATASSDTSASAAPAASTTSASEGGAVSATPAAAASAPAASTTSAPAAAPAASAKGS